MLRAVTLQPHPHFLCNNFHHGERIHPPAYTGEPMFANHGGWGGRLLAIGKNFTRGVEVVRSPNQGNGVRRTVEKVKAKKKTCQR